MIHSEYLLFLQHLHSTEASIEVRKIANLVWLHLNDLIPLTTRQGQRARKLVTLIDKNWSSLSSEAISHSESIDQAAEGLSSLKSISVGPFRGFSRQEVFDLDSRIVLIYGPNGTGKSSFCEALEYSLLGSVQEADNKRFRNLDTYLKNAHTDSYTQPLTQALDFDGNTINLDPNNEAYRFCFVEKNRIDSFSRIAAQAPSRQTELISTLFGLDSFTDFVKNFTPELDDRYIDLSGVKRISLTQKRTALAGAEQILKMSTQTLEGIAVEANNLVNNYRKGINYSQMQMELIGSPENEGLINQLEKELQVPPPPQSGLTSGARENLKNAIVTGLTALKLNNDSLSSASQEISFKNLYDAVLSLQTASPDSCPACKTPLNLTRTNPYINASGELKKLERLSSLQTAAEQIQLSLNQSLFSLNQVVNTCLRFFPHNNQLSAIKLSEGIQPDINWWSTIQTKAKDGCTYLQHIDSQTSALEGADNKRNQISTARTEKQRLLVSYRDIAQKITQLEARRTAAIESVKSAQESINNFDEKNKELIAGVDSEKEVIKRNFTIASSYATFVRLLTAYCKNLPIKLVADLSESVVELYNSFNRNDTPSELLSDLKLPLSQNEPLMVSFQSDKNRYYDALHILSEGHIRCVGLAILMAKNIKEESPFLIFDDPVNAIDEDHRESIRKTLFEDAYFSGKQILLTCHGEEFFKDIHNLLSSQDAKAANSYTFLPRNSEKHIQVDFNCTPRNYVLAARTHIERGEIREALTKSRKALESLTKGKVWNYVKKYGDGNLSLKLRGAKAPIELRNLTEQLKSKIGNGNFNDENKVCVYGPIGTLLGLNGNSREWRYLNKGTHDETDRSEFDRHTVNTIVSAIENIDAAL